jgi:hypothetical protein
MSTKLDNTEKLCNQLRNMRKRGNTYETITKEFDISISDTIRHVHGKCSCNTDTEEINPRRDEPWKERYVIECLYKLVDDKNDIELRRRFTEMGDILNCHADTAKKFVEQFNVSNIDSSNRTSSPVVNMLLEKESEKPNPNDIRRV